MSVSQFVRLFKRVAGTSFVTYLTHVRLSRAIRLLKESCLTIAQVACEVGFSDQSYFDRRFKESFGQTPRDFRRNFQSSGVNGKGRRAVFGGAAIFTNGASRRKANPLGNVYTRQTNQPNKGPRTITMPVNSIEQSAVTKFAIRLVPFLALMVFINYLDRTAISFAGTERNEPGSWLVGRSIWICFRHFFPWLHNPGGA